MPCPKITEGYRRVLLTIGAACLRTQRRWSRVVVRWTPLPGPEGGFDAARDTGLAPLPARCDPRDVYSSLATFDSNYRTTRARHLHYTPSNPPMSSERSRKHAWVALGRCAA